MVHQLRASNPSTIHPQRIEIAAITIEDVAVAAAVGVVVDAGDGSRDRHMHAIFLRAMIARLHPNSWRA
jgi:hypothetical protein